MTVNLGGQDSSAKPQRGEDLDRARRYEKLVAQCMKDAGFEYTPRVPSVSEPESSSPDPYSLPADEFAAQYGYGVSTLRSSQPAQPHPDTQAREQMSASDRKAYDAALYGDRNPAPEASGDDAAPDAGCTGTAKSRLENETNPRLANLNHGLLTEKLSELQWRIQFDDRLTDVTNKWTACMRDRGITDLAEVGDAQVAVVNRWDELAQVNEGQEPRSVEPDDLEAMQEFEITVAIADYECRAEHYQDTFDKVVHEHEAEFVDQHEDLLETFRDALKIDRE